MNDQRPLLDNIVQLMDGVPKRLHFQDDAIADREIRDPVTNVLKTVTTLQLVVDEEDGNPVAKTWSITSEALAAQLAPYRPGRQYRSYTFTVTRRGTGFATRYAVEATPRPS